MDEKPKKKSRKRVFRSPIDAILDDFNMEALARFEMPYLDYPTPYGRTAMFFAARDGRDDVVMWLLDRGADPGIVDEGGESPFLVGSDKLSLDTLKAMYAKGTVSLDVANKWGYSPIHKSASKGRRDVVEWLISVGDSIDRATESGYTARQMLARSLGSESEAVLGKSEETTAAIQSAMNMKMFIALSDRDLETLRFTLESGAQLDAEGKFASSPLDAASAKGYVEGVEMLLEYGADINAFAEKKRAPLHNACRNRDIEMISYLLSKGANPNLHDGKNLLPLNYLLRPKRVLDSDGYPVESSNPDDKVSLENERFVECVKLVLSKGADASLKTGGTRKGISPLGEAKKIGEPIRSWFEAEYLAAKTKLAGFSSLAPRRRGM